MRICFAISNYHLKNITAQPKIIKILADRISRKHEVFIIPETNIYKTWRYLKQMKPDVIFSNGYLMSVYMCFINLDIKARQFVFLSEVIETVDWVYRKLVLFCLRRVEKIFVTSDFLEFRLLHDYRIESEVTRVGYEG